MRKAIVVKTGAAVLAAVASSAITSSILARVVGQTPEGITRIVDKSKPDAGAAIPGPKPILIARRSQKSAVIKAQGDRVNVAASMSIFETRPDILNLWSIRVLDGTGRKKLSEHLYQDQTFSTPANVSDEYAFIEQFSLKPGSYRVELVLYTLHKDFDTRLLEDEAIAESCRSFSASEPVVIAAQ